MPQPTLVFTLGEEDFTLSGVSAQEMMKVQAWTTYRNRKEWFTGLQQEDPAALLAAFVLVKQRKGENVRFSDADFDLDSLAAKFVDETGREMEPVVEKNKDGTVKLDKDGAPIPVFRDGKAEWVYVDTGDPVPPTEAA
jgi:hypothetical protein